MSRWLCRVAGLLGVALWLAYVDGMRRFGWPPDPAADVCLLLGLLALGRLWEREP